MNKIKQWILISLLACSGLAAAHPSADIEDQANSVIAELYHKLELNPIPDLQHRIDWFSENFVGKPYILGALGEGPSARFDQFPRYRMDGFDCDTFVNTVIALALSQKADQFPLCLRHLRYKNGQIGYLSRNHFTSLDWNKNNQAQGVFKDITPSLTYHFKHAPNQIAAAMIDKPSWYAHKTDKNIRLFDVDAALQANRLDELRHKGQLLPIQESQMPYLPMSVLFNKKGEANLKLFAQIPSASIIEIVRPNWDLKMQIGTCLNVSHLGFAIWNNKTLYFRHASSEAGKVVDTPLIGYLRNTLKSPTIKGINIQIVLPASAQSDRVC